VRMAGRAAVISPRDDSLARIHAHALPAPYFNLSGWRSTWLAHIRDAAYVHLDFSACFACLGVPCGELGCALDHATWRVIGVLRHTDDHMTAGVSRGV